MNQCALFIAADVHIFRGIRSETIHTKQQKNNAGSDLQDITVMLILNDIHQKAHSKTLNQRINNIAHRCTNTRNNSIPTTLIECTLHT